MDSKPSFDNGCGIEGASDSSSDGKGVQERLRATAGGSLLDKLAVLEDIVQDAIEVADGVGEIEECLVQNKREYVLLESMLQAYSGNTKTDIMVQMRDWQTFSEIVYNRKTVDAKNLIWPPPLRVWQGFLIKARERVLSFTRFQNLVGTVSKVGCRIS